MKKILIVQRLSLVAEKLIFSRSVINRVTEPLSFLVNNLNVNYELEVKVESEIIENDIKSCDIIIFCKHASTKSLKIIQAAKELRKKVIYDIDDLIYKFQSNSLGARYNNKEILNAHLQFTDILTVSNKNLLKALQSDFCLPDHQVIQTGFNFNKYKKKCDYTQKSNKFLFTNADVIKLTSFKEQFFNTINSFLLNSNMNLDIFSDPNPELKNFVQFNDLGSLPWEEHKFYLEEENYQFAIVPLGGPEDKDSLDFYKCKTPIKYFESSALNIPGIYSNSAIYSSCVENMKTGVIVNNNSSEWLNALNLLTINHELRNTIAQNSYEDAFYSFNMKDSAILWRSILE